MDCKKYLDSENYDIKKSKKLQKCTVLWLNFNNVSLYLGDISYSCKVINYAAIIFEINSFAKMC
jgi:hypothetical protein